MIGVVLIFRRKLKQIDFQSLLKIIKQTEGIHYCIVCDGKSEQFIQSFKDLERMTDCVSVVDIKMHGSKSTLLKAAFRYFRGSNDLNYIGYFEFKFDDDVNKFSEIMTTMNNDGELIMKLKSWRGPQKMQRMIYKSIFSIVELFNGFYVNLRHT